MAFKVMLIEDEPGMRLLLRKIIERHTEYEVVAECETLADSVLQFHRKQPEIIFLDIGIKGESGIECARVLSDLNPKVKIIFATAHAEYMSEAFELYAFDYLVKPFDVERVNQTLDRIAELERSTCVEAEEKIFPSGYQQDKLLVKGKESMSFIHIPDIVLIQRENSTTVIYTETDSYATSVSMADLEKKLEKFPQFLRSHKSYLINLEKVSRIEPYGRWTYVVHFRGRREDALLTSEKFEEIKKRFR